VAEDRGDRGQLMLVESVVDDRVEPGLFESDDELEDFLADLYASRRAGMA
jgi:hypothetical protein